MASPLSENRPARIGLAIVTVLISAVLAIPAITGTDDFPVSSQPMFATPRADVAEFVTARGVGANGDTIDLTIDEIGETDDPLVAQEQLRDAERTNSLANTCLQIADRVSPSAASVEIVRIRHDLDAGIGLNARIDVEVLEQCRTS